MHVFRCVICDEEWLPRSMPSDFRLSQPQGGKGVCEKCVEKRLYEEPFEKKNRMWDSEDRIHRIETTVLSQPKSFSYDCYATTSEPRGPWTEHIQQGRFTNRRDHPGRSEHCRRLLRISIPCCVENCENEEFIVHFTENTVRRWGAGPLRIWFEGKSLLYKSAYYECCGIKNTPNDGDEIEEWADRFCEAEGHECESCKDWFENWLYTTRFGTPRHDDSELKRAYLALKENPTTENRRTYKSYAHYRRQKRHTRKPQLEATTNILDAFLGDDPIGCIRSGLTVGPQQSKTYSRSQGKCGFHVKSRDIAIPLPSGRFIGNGYLCSEHE